MQYEKRPVSIYDESMSIVSQYTSGLNLGEIEEQIYRRIIHTTGDPDIVRYISMSGDFVEKARILIARRGGFNIFTDVNMIKAGINQPKLSELGGQVICRIADPLVISEAKRTGYTRAITAVHQSKELINNNMVAVGNAPTALFALLELASIGYAPDIIIGTPVGFVGAKESKEELEQSGIPYLTIRGTRGGSAIAVAAVNALLYNLGATSGSKG